MYFAPLSSSVFWIIVIIILLYVFTTRRIITKHRLQNTHDSAENVAAFIQMCEKIIDSKLNKNYFIIDISLALLDHWNR